MLSQLCQEYGVPARITDWDKYRYRAPLNCLLGASSRLYTLSDFGTIVVGGHAITPELLGYRQMRKRSGDIDTVSGEDGLRALLEKVDSYDDVHYGIREEELFLAEGSIPLGVNLNRIHDWDVPPDFRESSILFEVDGIGPIRVAAPDYQIMLKLRRGRYCLDTERPFFGKDRIDIANLALASLYQGGVKHIDIRRLGELVLEHVSSDLNCLSILCSSLDNTGSLKKTEDADFKKFLREFSSKLGFKI
jgi:hypothetical protein